MKTTRAKRTAKRRRCLDYGEESVIVASREIEVRVAAYPEPVSYVRAVERGTGRELVYWVCDEWTEEEPADDPTSAIGAIFAVIKEVHEGATVAEFKRITAGPPRAAKSRP